MKFQEFKTENDRWGSEADGSAARVKTEQT
jgi:hypothetical protein